MNDVTFEKFIELVRSYNKEEVERVTKAYEYAKMLHFGQKRQSGEEYIIHPLNVSYILAEMHADSDTLCAGLLHDTLEDTNISKEDIAHEFNQTVANLVDGVTKISKMNFSTKDEQAIANTRKIITSITGDVRIIIIKLADRLHNMRTLQFKSEFKQKENSLETIEIFAPLAYYIGAYRIKSELEDISLRYLKPNVYNNIEQKMEKVKTDSEGCLWGMLTVIKRMLEDEDIPHEIKIRTKNIYGIYKQLSHNKKLSDIHDLLALKVMVDDVKNCYYTLMMVHAKYPPINVKFKDYICNPKTNMYRSLHTTVFGPDDRLVQTQIRTFDMDKIASFGLTAYWDINKGGARDIMQEDLREKYQFFRSLNEMNAMFSDNQQFVHQIKKELFATNIYVYTPRGDIIELPKGSTPIDFAYKVNTDLGDTMVGAVVNDEYVAVDYTLKNKDRVKIIADDLSFGSKENWVEKAQTSYAKRRIIELNKVVGDSK